MTDDKLNTSLSANTIMAKVTNHFQRLTNTIHLTLKITSAQVVETSVTNNSSSQNYTHPDDHTIRTTDTPGFKPFTTLRNIISCRHKTHILLSSVIVRIKAGCKIATMINYNALTALSLVCRASWLLYREDICLQTLFLLLKRLFHQPTVL